MNFLLDPKSTFEPLYLPEDYKNRDDQISSRIIQISQIQLISSIKANHTFLFGHCICMQFFPAIEDHKKHASRQSELPNLQSNSRDGLRSNIQDIPI